MGCSAQKRPNDHQKNLDCTKQNSQQIVIQNEMPDSNREFLIQMKTTFLSKGMVDRQNQMYPDRNQSPDADYIKQQGPTNLNSQNVLKSVVCQQDNTRQSQKANSYTPNQGKAICIQSSQNLRSLIKSNIPQVDKQQKNVTFQLKKLTRSPLSDKQFKRKKKVTLEHLERIF